MEKKTALNIINNSVEKYSKNLENNNLLFIYEEKGSLKTIETRFLSSNFLHLTGCKTQLYANEFYNKAINKRLKEDEFELISSGITEVKLRILSELIYIDKKARMIGDYSSSKLKLRTDKLIGGVNACVGFIKNNRSKYYVPNTLLGINIKSITNKPQSRIIAIFKKSIKDDKYMYLSYMAKGLLFQRLVNDTIIANIVDFSKIEYLHDC